MTSGGVLTEAAVLEHTAVADRLRHVLHTGRRRAAAHHGAFLELWDGVADTLLTGKKLRSALFLAAVHGLGGSAERAGAIIDVGCALELLHSAFLAHDDVIDGDLVRRGVPNIAGAAVVRATAGGAGIDAAARYGIASGILAGDLMLSYAQGLIAEIDADAATRVALQQLFADVIFDSVAGEHADVWFSLGLEQADPDRVLRTIELKTARYSFQAPLVAAAILCGVDGVMREELIAIGRGLGAVYQLRDDVLGVFGDPAVTGKSAVADLREGTQSLLIALARGTAEWREVVDRLGDRELDDDDADVLRAALRASGALERVEETIAAESQSVRRRILRSGIAPALELHLLQMLDRCRDRKA